MHLSSQAFIYAFISESDSRWLTGGHFISKMPKNLCHAWSDFLQILHMHVSLVGADARAVISIRFKMADWQLSLF